MRILKERIKTIGNDFISSYLSEASKLVTGPAGFIQQTRVVKEAYSSRGQT
jgi:hypothetical protein